METDEISQCENQGGSYSCFCARDYERIESEISQQPADQSIDFNLNTTGTKIEDFTDEERPLKQDKASECKLGGNHNRRFRALILCLILLLLVILGALLLNILSSKTSGVIFTPTTQVIEKHGAVASDYAECSNIGTNLLRNGGNAVDAAIGAAICMSVVAPHKTGLGGGGKIMIYSHRDHTNPLIVDFSNNTNSGMFATAKVRLPGFIRGLEFAQSLRGNLPWQRIVEPAAKLARDGFIVTKDLAKETGRSVEHGMIFGHLRPRETLQLPVLAETLDTIAQLGANSFYNGSLSLKVLRDAVIKDELLHELSTYEPRVIVGESATLHNYEIFIPPQAHNFHSIIKDLDKLQITEENSSSFEARTLSAMTIIKSLEKNIEILKKLEREKYSAIVAMDYLDLYVSIVTGLSAPFGLAHMTGAGFLLDGVDDDNRLELLTPIIFRDHKRVCGLRGVFGTDDPLLASQILYNILLRSLNVSSAIEYPRFYILSDGIAMESDEEHSVDPLFRAQLESEFSVSRIDLSEFSRSVNAITKHGESMSSHADSRGNGRASRY